MSEFRNCTTGEVCSDLDFRKKIPNESFPLLISKEDLFKYGYEPIVSSPKPVANKNQVVINAGTKKDENGDWVYDWRLTNIPDDVLNAKLKARQDEVWRRIQLQRELISEGGIFVDDKWFHTDNGSLTKYLSLLVAGENILPNLMWKTMDGSKVLMTPLLVKNIYNTAMVFNNAVFNVGETLKEQMLLAEDPESIDITVGWPTIYNQN